MCCEKIKDGYKNDHIHNKDDSSADCTLLFACARKNNNRRLFGDALRFLKSQNKKT